jgi:hypothetical protein
MVVAQNTIPPPIVSMNSFFERMVGLAFGIWFVIWIYLNILNFIVVLHSYDNIALFVPLFNIPVSLDNLFQRIAQVNDRSYFPRFDQLFQENQIF